MAGMRIAIIGAGAVGGYFGARLRESGADVTLIARCVALDAIRSAGVRVTDPQGERTVPVPVVESLAEAGAVDVVLVTTKALRESTSVAALLAGLPANAVVATTQNAVEVPRAVAEVVGADRVWPGVVRGFFIHTGPGRVEYRGGPLSYTFGDTGETSREFARILQKAGIDGVLHPDIWVDVWEKAMFVTTFGALGALLEQPLGVLCTRARASLEALMEEVAAVARATGVALPADAVARTMDFADRMPAASTSSMQRDLAAGVDSELDAQVGAILRVGHRHGVDTRLHQLIHTGLALRMDSD